MEIGGPQFSWRYNGALTNFTGFCQGKSGGNVLFWPHLYSEEGSSPKLHQSERESGRAGAKTRSTPLWYNCFLPLGGGI